MWTRVKSADKVQVLIYLFVVLRKCSTSALSNSADGRLSEFREPLLIAESIYADVGQVNVVLSCPILRVHTEQQTQWVTSAIIWILDREDLIIAANQTVMRDKRIKYACFGTTGQLNITNVTEMDSGIYRCILSTNKASYQTAAVELAVGGKNALKRPPALLGHPGYLTSEWEREKGTGSKRQRNSLGRALGAGVAAFIFFCVSCTLYHYRWKPTPISSLEQSNSTESDAKLQLSSATSPSFPLLISSPPTPPSPPQPPVSRVYLLSNNRQHNSSDASIIHPCSPLVSSLPPLPSTTMFTPPVITTTVEMTTISGKKLATRSRDGSRPAIFLQPPLLTSSYSTTNSGSTPSSNNASKKISLLHPPASSPSQKKYLATPESSSSLSLVAEEESTSGGLLTTTTTATNYIPTSISTFQKY